MAKPVEHFRNSLLLSTLTFYTRLKKKYYYVMSTCVGNVNPTRKYIDLPVLPKD